MAERRKDFLLQPYQDANGNTYYDFPLEDTISPDGVYLPTPYGFSDDQHKLDIILCNLGSLKRFPLLGFGILQYEKAEYDQDSVNASLIAQMKSDGYRVNHGAVIPNGNGFVIDTDYISKNY